MAAEPIHVELSHASLDPPGTPRVDHTQKWPGFGTSLGRVSKRVEQRGDFTSR